MDSTFYGNITTWFPSTYFIYKKHWNLILFFWPKQAINYSDINFVTLPLRTNGIKQILAIFMLVFADKNSLVIICQSFWGNSSYFKKEKNYIFLTNRFLEKGLKFTDLKCWRQF